MGKGIRFSAPGICIRTLYAAAILSDPTRAWETDPKRKSPFYLLIRGSIKRFIYFAPASMHYRGLREAIDRLGYGIVHETQKILRGERGVYFHYKSGHGVIENGFQNEDPVQLMLKIVGWLGPDFRESIIRNHEERHHAGK